MLSKLFTHLRKTSISVRTSRAEKARLFVLDWFEQNRQEMEKSARRGYTAHRVSDPLVSIPDDEISHYVDAFYSHVKKAGGRFIRSSMAPHKVTICFTYGD